jgi:tetraacyldisaccharide 4'-kinase
MKRPSIEMRVKAVIQSQSNRPSHIALRALLRLASWPYALITGCRNRAYDWGLLRQHRAQGAVISIGNIVAGGTGKTPTTIMLAAALSPYYPTAILSRGYRSEAEKLPLPTLVDVQKHSANFCGDEPLLIAKRLPEVSVFVGKNRIAATHMAVEKRCQIMILDDGMQHRRLRRDLEIVVMDASDPFGKGFLLPRGLLRESLRGLRRADYIIVNHAKVEELPQLQQRLAPFTPAPLIATAMELSHVRRFPNDTIDTIRNKKVGLYCGIANPVHFRQMLQKQGATIVNEWVIGDHMAPQEDQLLRFMIESQRLGAEAVICTEKDRVKLAEDIECPLPILWTEAELRIIAGEEHWHALLKRTYSASICSAL